jgi:hypothetical protein
MYYKEVIQPPWKPCSWAFHAYPSSPRLDPSHCSTRLALGEVANSPDEVVERVRYFSEHALPQKGRASYLAGLGNFLHNVHEDAGSAIAQWVTDRYADFGMDVPDISLPHYPLSIKMKNIYTRTKCSLINKFIEPQINRQLAKLMYSKFMNGSLATEYVKTKISKLRSIAEGIPYVDLTQANLDAVFIKPQRSRRSHEKSL